MGIDITHIIKHDFRQTHDIQLSLEFAKETIERLKRGLLIQDSNDNFGLEYDEDLNEIRFELPVYNVEFSLHSGFWQVESCFHYCQLVIHKDDYFLLRWLTYDIARTLGIPLFIEPVDGILCPLNGPEFVIVKNGLSAVFNAYGKQLTDFVKGHFKWKRAPVNPLYGYQHDRIIYNKEANIQLHTAWPMFQDE